MYVVITFVMLFFKLHDGIGATGCRVAVVTEQARTPQSCFTRQHVYAIAAKTLLNAFTIQYDRFGRTGAKNGSQNAGWEMCVAHAGTNNQK